MKKVIRKGIHKGVTLLIMGLLIAIIAKLIPRVVSHEQLSQAEEKIDAVIDEKADQVREISKKGAHKTFTLIEDMSQKDEIENKKIS